MNAMRRTTIAALLFLSGALGAAGPSDGVDAAPADPSAEAVRPLSVPLADYLNPDGTLSLPLEGVVGSIDPTGFDLVGGPGGAPRFQPSAEGADRRAAGDENWDPSFFSALFNDSVQALAWNGSDLYAGGKFTDVDGVPAVRVARWDGAAWRTLGGGLNGAVRALAWDGSNLYAGGDFWTAGSWLARCVAKWDGMAWSPLGSGMDGSVYALAWDGSALYAGGAFTMAGGAAAAHIAKWDGSSWSPLGEGTDDIVYALAWNGADLWAGGQFTLAGGMPAGRIAKWDGSAWSPLGAGMNNHVYALAWDGTNLYAGGRFTMADGTAANRIAKWNGSAWSPLGSGVDGVVDALAWDGVSLYAGGSFAIAGGAPANYIARWDGGNWSVVGTGAIGHVNAIVMVGTGLAAGMEHDNYSSNAEESRIMLWDEMEWHGLPDTGAGMNSSVLALLNGGTGLYAAGYFTFAGAVPAQRIAKWNGSAWNPLDSGLNSSVTALAWDGTNLYAGGYFTFAGGLSAKYIARWNGSAWSPLGTGMNSVVYALAWDGTNLFAGGDFTTAGGIAAKRIAKWNGSAWSPLGSGVTKPSYDNSTVRSLIWDGSCLYAGGWFTTAGGVAANNIARWDGTQWSPLGSGIAVHSYVSSLFWDGAFLYAGGSFRAAGGIGCNNIAKWDGANWSPLGSGVDGSVYSLAGDGGIIYAGGGFTQAGMKSSAHIGRWTNPPCSTPSLAAPVSALDADACAFSKVDLAWPMDAADWGDAGVGTRAYDVLRDGIAIASGLPYGTAQYADATGTNGTPYAYAVRYWNGCGLLAATPTATAADQDGSPGAPAISGIFDMNACLQDGVWVEFSAGAGADAHDLYMDGSLAVPGYVEGSPFDPGDSAPHWYVVRARNAVCSRDSVGGGFADRMGLSPTVTGPVPACVPGMLGTQAFASYQWYRNGFPIYGATAQMCEAVAPGTYTVRITDAYACPAVSPGFVIQPSPPIPAISGPVSGCASAGVVLSTGAYTAYQWTRDGAEIPGATAFSYPALLSGDYRVRVANASGCTALSPVHAVAIHPDPQPEMSGAPVNACPATTVSLTTGAFAAHQWLFNGAPIPGATARTYDAMVTGNYAVSVVDGNGCSGRSSDSPVFVDFCPATEVSPARAIHPLRVVKSAASSTGYFLFFQRVDSTDGYNLYEGELVAPWDGLYHHGGQPGNRCGLTATDLGTGEMRASFSPAAGDRYYLVTAYGGGSEGPSGFNSVGSEVPESQSTCAP